MSPDYERLVGRAVTDKAFRDKLIADVDSTLKEAGLNLTEAEVQEVKNAASKASQASSAELDQEFVFAAGGWK